jgi:2-polyprenyl-3-methyl-5-hydroxy-6-metoxy-1,4-benzoquinol methylase
MDPQDSEYKVMRRATLTPSSEETTESKNESSDFRSRVYSTYVSDFKQASFPSHRRVARQYQFWDRKMLPFLKSLDESSRILELGCGPGLFLQYLKSRGFSSSEGIDLSAEQIEVARSMGLGESARVGDVMAELSKNVVGQKYDAIVAIDIVEHFERAEVDALISLICQNLRPGGVCIIQTVNGAGLFPGQIIYGDITHATVLTPESLSHLIRRQSVERIRFIETGPIANDLVGLVRIAAWFLVRVLANCVRIIEAGKTQQIWTENMICAFWR